MHERCLWAGLPPVGPSYCALMYEVLYCCISITRSIYTRGHATHSRSGQNRKINMLSCLTLFHYCSALRQLMQHTVLGPVPAEEQGDVYTVTLCVFKCGPLNERLYSFGDFSSLSRLCTPGFERFNHFF